MSEVESINRDFVRAIEANPIHQSTQEIAILAVKASLHLQRAAIGSTLAECLGALRRIDSGQIPISGKEAGYFRRWVERVKGFEGAEHVKAYIRLPAFDPEDLLSKNWYAEFYDQLRDMVKSRKLTIRYVFLLATSQPTTGAVAFLDNFKEFAQEIRIVHSKGAHLSPEQLRPSIVLFQSQRTAFTHDRGDNGVLIEADEWIYAPDYERLSRAYDTIEMASEVYFSRPVDT